MNVTIMPDQATALAALFADTGAVALDIAQADFWSLRVVTYHPSDERDPASPPAEARLWTISVCGTVREQSPTPAEVAA